MEQIIDDISPSDSSNREMLDTWKMFSRHLEKNSELFRLFHTPAPQVPAYIPGIVAETENRDVFLTLEDGNSHILEEDY